MNKTSYNNFYGFLPFINSTRNNNYSTANIYNFNNDLNDNNEMFDSELADITKKRLDKLDETLKKILIKI